MVLPINFSSYSTHQDPYIIVNSSGDIEEANPAANSLFCSSEQYPLNTRSWTELVHPIEQRQNFSISGLLKTPTMFIDQDCLFEAMVTITQEDPENHQKVIHLTECKKKEDLQGNSLLPKSEIKILLAEDGTIVADVLKQKLKNLGFLENQIVHAENGQIAVEEVTKQPFHFIIMDNQMPKMNGIEATGQIRVIEKTKQYSRSIVLFHSSDAFPKADKEASIGSQRKPLFHELFDDTLPNKPPSLRDLKSAFVKHWPVLKA